MNLKSKKQIQGANKKTNTGTADRPLSEDFEQRG
jgi:hypothetical protein